MRRKLAKLIMGKCRCVAWAETSRIGGKGVRGGRGWTGITSRLMGSRTIRYTNQQQVANFSLAEKHLRLNFAELGLLVQYSYF